MMSSWDQQHSLGQRPAILGAPTAGSVLTVIPPVLIPGTYTYQWYLLGAPIPLATNNTLVSVAGLITVTAVNTSLPGNPSYTSVGINVL